jgi:catechol 2,3-dioxygenase-like lactoylglutathione lyase family enzyme
MATIPDRLLSQLAHVELINPNPERSARFFHDVLGLEESGRDGRSIYFRGWGERFHHSLIVTEGPEALGHIGWRAASPETLMHAAQRLEASGHGDGWIDAVTGDGPAYRFRGPGGHVEEVFWEVERFRATGELAPVFPHRPQRYRPGGWPCAGSTTSRSRPPTSSPTRSFGGMSSASASLAGPGCPTIRTGSSSPSARRTSRHTTSVWCSN